MTHSLGEELVDGTVPCEDDVAVKYARGLAEHGPRDKAATGEGRLRVAVTDKVGEELGGEPWRSEVRHTRRMS